MCPAAVIPADTVHEVVRGARVGRLVHVAPESAPGARLTASVRAHTVQEWARAGAELFSDPDWFEEIHRSVTVAATSDRHPAVSHVLALLPHRLESGPVRLADLAREARLSESLLAHVFSADVGLPLRPYIRWLRMQRAIRFIADGHNFTTAAHGAGFADSAHLTRFCRSMFGAPPSDFTRVRWTIAPEVS
ncbi:helix-turn-helix transcriptional regulator [Nocardia crassostreae]|uniref:helix-turn-helix transcriptional regulator n=1 Tax=Nocardia crassostreae TaxID=53428 RepID=UPI000829C97A|nr:helix-turn-helix transcriptional regulator [Nocardia crassostreae]